PERPRVAQRDPVAEVGIAGRPERGIELAVQLSELLRGLRREQMTAAVSARVLGSGTHRLLVVGGVVALVVAADHEPLERLAGPEAAHRKRRRGRYRLEPA